MQGSSPCEEGRGFPFRDSLPTGGGKALLPVTAAAPAGSPSDKHTHFMNRKGEAVRVGISSGLMAKKGWGSQSNFRLGFLTCDISGGHPPQMKCWPETGRPCPGFSGTQCPGPGFGPMGEGSLMYLPNRAVSLPSSACLEPPEAYMEGVGMWWGE